MISQSTLTLFIGGFTPSFAIATVAAKQQQHNVADIEWTEETNIIANNVRVYHCFLPISLMYKYTRYI